uniref:Uncharacterized protein n=1 Tax=Arundo donax TaxID=35708 RepID=A0A0A8ZRU6_ARUDO
MFTLVIWRVDGYRVPRKCLPAISYYCLQFVTHEAIRLCNLVWAGGTEVTELTFVPYVVM